MLRVAYLLRLACPGKVIQSNQGPPKPQIKQPRKQTKQKTITNPIVTPLLLSPWAMWLVAVLHVAYLHMA